MDTTHWGSLLLTVGHNARGREGRVEYLRMRVLMVRNKRCMHVVMFMIRVRAGIAWSVDAEGRTWVNMAIHIAIRLGSFMDYWTSSRRALHACFAASDSGSESRSLRCVASGRPTRHAFFHIGN